MGRGVGLTAFDWPACRPSAAPSFARFFLCGLSDADAGPTAVIVDEFTHRLSGSLTCAPFRNSEKARSSRQAFVVTDELNALLLRADKLQGREVNSIQRPHRNRKRLQGAREHGSNHFDHRNTADQIAHCIAMRSLQPVRVDTIPNLAF